MIQKDYYKLIKNKILVQIKRLYYLKLNFLSNIIYKINQNFFNISNKIKILNNTNFNSENNSNHQKINLNYSKSIIIDDDNTKKIDITNEIPESENNSGISTTNHTSYIKIKKPVKNKFSKYFGHFNYELEKNNNWSPVALKYTKYNKDYFNNEKLDNITKNNNIYKNTNQILNNSDCKTNYNDIIKTLLSFEPKKEKFDKFFLSSPSKELNLKKMINIGNNHIFTLEQLKSKMKKNSLSQSMINLSIVKNIHNKTMNPLNLKKIHKNENVKSFLSYKFKNNSLLKFKKMKLIKYYSIYHQKDNSKNLSETNILDSKNNKDFQCYNYKQIKTNYTKFNNILHKALINKIIKK